jgi:hypothetical protein
MFAILIVLLGILTLGIFEVNFLLNQRVKQGLMSVYLIIGMILPLMDQNLISDWPFYVLLLTNFLRFSWFDKEGFQFSVLSVTNLMILYFQFGFLIKNYLLSYYIY